MPCSIDLSMFMLTDSSLKIIGQSFIEGVIQC